ncbi:EVE domain-containing protein [Agrobacterium pusense]|uniref:EVE domain-containing protein n=1 Tax=Agrobacterium pusense TaxID=648995 RepID=UPI001C6E5CF3|nr:EVE domain-containing protein [Agrobacterium pusense]MBW9060896.1 HNH endonuclease [Agrobacterium pusense]
MIEQIKRSLGTVKNFKALTQLEKNVRARVDFNEEVMAAFKDRAEFIAREMIAERTGLDLSELTPAEGKVVHAVSEYLAIKRREGSDATRTLTQLRNRGLIESAEAAVSKSKPTQGFERLRDEDLDDLSYEQIIIDHPEEFSPRALWYARRTLGLPNLTEKAPARRSIPVQIRTEELLNWLSVRANENDGHISPFTNLEAASALGMTDMTRHGRVQGNIQSRIDFACYRLGFPPLGLTAAAPFTDAWRQEDRSWTFPLKSMQQAAREFRWRTHHFDRLTTLTHSLSGQAHALWKAELRDNQTAVRAWAEGLENGTRASTHPGAEELKKRATSRNPDWTREEHILGLDLYLRLRGTSYPDEHPEVIKLSQTLLKLASLRKMSGSATFRNANGVSMKMLNFRRADLEYKGAGLPAGSKLEAEIWEEFVDEPQELAAAVDKILRELESLDSHDDTEESSDDRYWVLVCNPAKWAIDEFLASGRTSDSWGVRPSDARKFAAGQLAFVRVGVDRRSVQERNGRAPLMPGIYALCEIEGEAFPGSGADGTYWAKGSAREPGWPTVAVRYLRTYLDRPLSIDRLREERPDLSHLLLDGFQAASFPISGEDFRTILEVFGENLKSVAERPAEEASTSDRLAELESKFIHASPEVKTRVSRGVERGPVGREVKRLNGFHCQMCKALGSEPLGFRKRNGEPYIEAHHVMPVHKTQIGSLSAANIVTLCANHHREVHYGNVSVTIGDNDFVFVVAGQELTIPRAKINTASTSEKTDEQAKDANRRNDQNSEEVLMVK